MSSPKNLIKNKLLLLLLLPFGVLHAQTETDAIMMNKHQFCSGFVYNHSSWDHYWEGTLRRDNENLGTVTTQSLMYMANYGINNNLNIMAAAPYVWTKASAGTLHGMSGFQDLSVFVKWRAVNKKFGKNKIMLFALGGASAPLGDYVADFLPMSIGLHAKTLTLRGMADYQRGRFTVTGSAAFLQRSNVHIDRTAYFDTEMHYTNEVDMPNAAMYQFRSGYRGKYLLAEAVLTRMSTIGGFDITRNNMPFPSNRMNATTVGAQFKYTLKGANELSIIAGGSSTIGGRNMGQAVAVNAGIFYAFYFKK